MQSLFLLIDVILELYIWLLFIWVVISWLVAFEIINTRNRVVYVVTDFLHRITEPVLRPIRRVIPTLSGIDISPVVLILGIWFLRNLMREYLIS
jgi:YggT family protein